MSDIEPMSDDESRLFQQENNLFFTEKSETINDKKADDRIFYSSASKAQQLPTNENYEYDEYDAYDDNLDKPFDLNTPRSSELR